MRSMLRLFLDHDRDRLVSRLFRQAVAHPCTSDDLDGEAPAGLTADQIGAPTNLLAPLGRLVGRPQRRVFPAAVAGSERHGNDGAAGSLMARGAPA